MKNLFVGLILLFPVIGFARGGVGGFEGGHIHFQKESTYMSVMGNNALCLNKDDEYQGLVSFKKRNYGFGNNQDQVMATKRWIYQPRISYKEACKKGARRFGRDRECRDKDLEWVPYIQKRDVKVIIKKNDRDHMGKEIIVRIPDC